MITIDQLLESVDLDFEPRFVTKDKSGWITIWEEKPYCCSCNDSWQNDKSCNLNCGYIKLAEFENKRWTECIYEVPRKTTGKIERLEIREVSHGGENMVLHIQKIPATAEEMHEKINEIIDWINKVVAVNELKGE
jgi:hypothetical protein